ncbi:DUF402 domain-containing protein [Actinoplanes sp. NPDC051475]|uniref:DUF402 domain-containing protein n=1 Tax=Actinoplanes sp. NPDC051475 TaxID=3157225 RepID=UPI00344C1FF9
MPSDSLPTFPPRSTVVRRFLHADGRLAAAQAAFVVADDERGLFLWSDIGSATMRRTDLTGTPTRHLPVAQELAIPTMLSPSVRETFKSLLLLPPSAGSAISWSWLADGTFAGWYVNLETPARRWSGGTDSHDRTLDLLVTADRQWFWKDEEEFAAAHPGPEGDKIRAEGERIIKLVATAEFPFDGCWRDFSCDWGPAPLPACWDVPA